MKTKRLEYIDIIRSIAIIMMLEGHFMTHSLQTVFRNPDNPIYEFWKFTRGLTAPLFLTISGLIFSYLLLKNKTQGWNNPRVQKGFKRIGVLIILGYLLQFNLFTHYFRERPLFTSLTAIFHVLQCIGTSLAVLISLYLFRIYVLKIGFGIQLMLLGLLVFIFTPTLYEANYNQIPRFLENILIISTNTKLKTSVFPLFPWAGYVFFGGALGCVIVKLKEKAHHIGFPILLIISAFVIKHITYPVLAAIQTLPFFNTLVPFEFKYEPVRFSQVLIFIGLIILFQKGIVKFKEWNRFVVPTLVIHSFLFTSFAFGCLLLMQPLETSLQNITAYSLIFIPIVISLWKLTGWNYNTFLSIGQNTLSVYVLHVILLYQGFFGFRIDTYIKNELTPFTSILGAIAFVFLFLAYTTYESLLMQKLHRLKVRLKIVKRKRQYRASAA